MTEIYDVTNYDDEELYEILGFNLDETSTPEPGTIESTIINQLQDYQYSRTVTGRKMYQFLKDIYNHFFTQFDETEDDQEDDFTYRDLNVLENVDYNPDQVELTTPQTPTTPKLEKIHLHSLLAVLSESLLHKEEGGQQPYIVFNDQYGGMA